MKLLKYVLFIFFISIIHMDVVMAYDVEEVRKTTSGIGVFTVTVDNTRDTPVIITAWVTLSGSVIGHKLETPLESFSNSQRVVIDAHSSTSVQLIKPLVGVWPDYTGEGPELTEGSTVVVGLGAFIRRQNVSYDVQYVPGTKFIEVPDTTFTIKK